MITCTRCGKENQDHYKFCLGCGAELKRIDAPQAEAAAPSPVAPPQTESPSLDASVPPAREALPLEVARTILPPDPGATPAPDLGGAKKKSGIPWNDSPKPPAAFGPGFASASATPRPVLGSGPSGLVSGAITSPPSGPTGGLVCPNCGKPVPPGYAFCGSCGTRMSAPASRPSTQPRSQPVPVAPPAPRGRLVLIRPDGSEGLTHPLHDGATMIGRGQAAIFDQDAYLSPRHAELTLAGEGLNIRDLHSLNGVFVKIIGEEEIQSGDVFRIGQELLRFDVIAPPSPLEDGTEVAGTPNPGFWGRLSVVVGRDVDGSAFPLFGDAVVLGRERGDILFPEDGYVSGTPDGMAAWIAHCGRAVELGARESAAVCEALQRGAA